METTRKQFEYPRDVQMEPTPKLRLFIQKGDTQTIYFPRVQQWCLDGFGNGGWYDLPAHYENEE